MGPAVHLALKRVTAEKCANLCLKNPFENPFLLVPVLGVSGRCHLALQMLYGEVSRLVWFGSWPPRTTKIFRHENNQLALFDIAPTDIL